VERRGDFLIPQKTAPDTFMTNSQTKVIVEPGQGLSILFDGGGPGGAVFEAYISGVIVPAP
jgi:hypothetical protein